MAEPTVSETSSPENTSVEAILEVRRSARAEIVNVDEESCKLVVFTLGDDAYALQGEKVREILAAPSVYPLPGCPPSMEGVMNVRGDIESVVCLRMVLGHPKGSPTAASRVLLAQAQAMRSGLRVDRVTDVVDVPISSILPPPFNAPATLKPLLQGVVRLAETWVNVLDVETLFSDYCHKNL